jgi:hypothetical protein
LGSRAHLPYYCRSLNLTLPSSNTCSIYNESKERSTPFQVILCLKWGFKIGISITHGITLTGVVEDSGDQIKFILISYVLDKHEKAVYMLKATGNKILKDPDTISVVNLVLHFYNDPENCNPVTDTADFTIPETGTFPPVHVYRIK